jgi:DNA repair exonuclease SbcCD ATPase subunit
MKKVISVQDKTIREKDVEIAELRKKLNDQRKDAEDAAEAYKSQISALREQLADVEEICKRQQARLDELEKAPANEKTVLDMLSLICFFCEGLTGSAAYIMGRIVELLLEWRKTGSGEALRDFLEQFMEEKE